MIQHAMEALPALAVIGGGVILLATFGRDSKADEHDLSDYHEAAPVNPAPQSLRHFEALNSRPIPATMRVRYDFDITPEPEAADYTWGYADDILPPAPEGMNAGSPLYAGMLFDTWFPESAEDTAARFLRELRDEALAGAR